MVPNGVGIRPNEQTVHTHHRSKNGRRKLRGESVRTADSSQPNLGREIIFAKMPRQPLS